MNTKTISVIGLGYIGLPTAAMFASRGIKVIGVDINKATVDTINKGRIHIVEPGLGDIVRAAVSSGCLRATVSAESADAFLIAVPTPFLPVESGELSPTPDLRYIKAAANSISKVLKVGDLVILESTSPVGATEQMASWLAELREDLTFPQTHGGNSDVRIAHCPERVLPGKVLQELIENDRVVGGMTDNCSRAAVALYKIFVEGDCIVTNMRTAEMTKLTENAARDVGIAFANELSIICDKLDINVWELISLANRHPRVNILQPGPGVGGHCIAVDPWFIVAKNPAEAQLIRTARNVNDSKPGWAVDKILEAKDAFVDKVVVNIACLGISFKADIDDLRESPSMKIVEQLVDNESCNIFIVEPNIDLLPPTMQGKADLVHLDEALEIAEIIVVLVNHREFSTLKLPEQSEQKLLDFCGAFHSDMEMM